MAQAHTSRSSEDRMKSTKHECEFRLQNTRVVGCAERTGSWTHFFVKFVHISVALAWLGSQGVAQTGQELYAKFCIACHSIGGGRLVGPDLKGITNKRSETWLLSWIKSSQTMVKSGDKDAVAIFKEFNQIPMPDQPLSEDQIRSILAYVASGATTSVAAAPAIQGDEERGKNLFSGIERLQNGGPSCASCHNVADRRILSGGGLAVDLTQTVSRITPAGVVSVLSALPFPAMKQAFGNAPLAEDEIADLVAFLNSADAGNSRQIAGQYGQYMGWGAFAGAGVLLLVFYLVWMDRRTRAVNYRVFARSGYGKEINEIDNPSSRKQEP